MLVVNVSSVAVVWFGGHRIQAGQMRVGALTALIAYILQILVAIMMAMYVFMAAPRANASAERIREILDLEPTITDPVATVMPAPSPTAAGSAAARNADGADAASGRDMPSGCTLEFRAVSFSHPGAEAPVLDDVSFTAKPATTTAIIGATGSGKTTLLNLLPRFVDATAGEIRIDGRDIRSMTLDTLRAHMALVPQHSFLFAGTVAENLRLGLPAATDEELWQALRTAQADDFIRTLAPGLGISGEPGRHELLRRAAAAAVHSPCLAAARSRLPV